MTKVHSSLYVQVVTVTNDYLGPAAERFVYRQVQNHLHKDPSELSQDDLANLIDWVRVAVSLITEDTKLIEDYIYKLEQLTHTHTSGSAS
jgi:hypothetical protein